MLKKSRLNDNPAWRKRETAKGREVAQRLTREERKVEVHPRSPLLYRTHVRNHLASGKSRVTSRRNSTATPIKADTPFGRLCNSERRADRETKSKGWGQSTGPRSRVHPHGPREETRLPRSSVQMRTWTDFHCCMRVRTIYSVLALLKCWVVSFRLFEM